MFIVLEGLDGAGKSTQIRLLRDYLQSRGIQSRYLHFPRFDAPVYGELIARFLRGELGGVNDVDPYVVALLYAGDRADAATQIRAWIAQGEAVIVDRYVYSNIGYQCAKKESREEKAALKQWILNLEYKVNSIPKPDVSLFLDVPFKFTQSKLTSQREGEDRDYLHGSKDIHESSLELQRQVRMEYLRAAEEDSAFRVVDCGLGGEMNTPEGIFEKIREQIDPLLEEYGAESKK